MTDTAVREIATTSPYVAAAIVLLARRVRALECATDRVIPWLFPHLEGVLAGQSITDPRKA